MFDMPSLVDCVRGNGKAANKSLYINAGAIVEKGDFVGADRGVAPSSVMAALQQFEVRDGQGTVQEAPLGVRGVAGEVVAKGMG